MVSGYAGQSSSLTLWCHDAPYCGPGRPRAAPASAFTSAGIPRSGELAGSAASECRVVGRGGPERAHHPAKPGKRRSGPLRARHGVRSGVAQGSGALSVACPLRGIRRGARPTGRPAAIRLPSLRTLPVRDASASPARGNGAVTRASLQKPRCDGLGHTAADHDGDHGQNGPDTDGFLHVRISIVASTAMNRTR